MPLPTLPRLPAWAGLCCAAALLAGCVTLDVPQAGNYAPTTQKKARAVHHWDVLAEDVAQRVADKLRATATPQAVVYVAPTADVAADTAFRQGFRELLMTRLLDRGVRVATHEEGALRLQIDTQVVRHASGPQLNNPLPWTTLALGVVVLRDLMLYSHEAASINASALALGAATDAGARERGGHASGGPTGLEVLVSTSLQGQGLYLARTADVYYIEQADTALYQPAPPAPVPAATPLKAWKVVNQ